MKQVLHHAGEVAAFAILRVTVLRGAVDRHGQAWHAAADHGFQDLMPHVIEVDAVGKRDRHIAAPRDVEDRNPLRIEKRLAVIRQLDALDMRLRVRNVLNSPGSR